jgi:anti-sigma factor ChrR (cupin superfamily)
VLSPKDGWLIYGRQVLRVRPTRWDRDVQLLKISTGELPAMR